ncbi:MAG: dihydropteroate synthase [Syntrophomonadaceae bacterium]|nr:dihydropteroate synthase [Syntrophomonadaceae bacterium]
MDGIRVVRINDTHEAEELLREIGADEMGIKIMIPKSVFRAVKINGIRPHVANIIKQEMLSKGGEAAVNRQTILGGENTDILVMGTLKQFEQLLIKLRIQPFGLKKLAARIEQALQASNSNRRFSLKLPRGRTIELGMSTLIMGVLNVTPDSFFDGGLYLQPDQACLRAEEMVAQGADVIDLGGVSTRPGATPVSFEEEAKRVIPALREIRQKLPDVPVSIDTFNAQTARMALREGADFINDPSGLKADAEMIEVAAGFGCPVIVQHNRMGGGYQDLMTEILGDLEEALTMAHEGGIQDGQIIIDPGIGFGKTAEQNFTLIKNLAEFKVLDKPILLGVSNKAFIGRAMGDMDAERVTGSLAAAVVGVMNGADMVRMHNIEETRRALAVIDKIRRAW